MSPSFCTMTDPECLSDKAIEDQFHEISDVFSNILEGLDDRRDQRLERENIELHRWTNARDICQELYIAYDDYQAAERLGISRDIVKDYLVESPLTKALQHKVKAWDAPSCLLEILIYREWLQAERSRRSSTASGGSTTQN